jgi:GntR family transcriptional regulator / MocR family aminotransferase
VARWDFTIQLERGGRIPLFQQIARSITEDIRRGRLRPGDGLPGTRSLARTLRVQRLTVVSAYDELVAEGWLVTRRARGAFVSPALPPAPRRPSVGSPDPAGVPKRTMFNVASGPPAEMPYDTPPGTLLFAPNRPDVRLIPHDLIGRAYRRAIRHAGQILLSYGRPQGHERLRVAIAAMLSSTRGIAATADDVCITRGSQMALALLARSLVRPGDVIGVEELSYRPAVEIFRLQGATVLPIALDDEGLKIEPLERIAATGRLRAVYVTPHHQFPTTVTLSAARRLRLLELARTKRFAIIEEDYDHEFHYDGSPVLPLASADTWGVVAYVGTLSKVLAPALRTGYVVAPRSLLAPVIAHRLYIDVQGDRVLEYALAELMEDGEIQRHINRARREYAVRRDVLVQALRQRLGGYLTFKIPAGGIALWVRVTDDIDIEAWAKRAHARGAVMVTAAAFALDKRPRSFARLGFANLNSQELQEGVHRLAMAASASS